MQWFQGSPVLKVSISCSFTWTAAVWLSDCGGGVMLEQILKASLARPGEKKVKIQSSRRHRDLDRVLRPLSDVL